MAAPAGTPTTASGDTDFTIALPSGTTNGELLACVIGVNNFIGSGADRATLSGGFSEQASTFIADGEKKMSWFTRAATGVGAGPFTISVTGGLGLTVFAMMTRVSSTDLRIVDGQGDTFFGTTWTVPTMTSDEATCLMMAGVWHHDGTDANDFALPSTYTLLSSTVGLEVVYKTLGGASTYGGETAAGTIGGYNTSGIIVGDGGAAATAPPPLARRRNRLLLR